MKRLKLCVIAYACEPGKGSEPEVGWRWSHALAGFADVTVITRANNKRPIEKESERLPYLSLTFEYVDLPDWALSWKKKQRNVHLYYAIWQILAVVKAYRLHKKHKFDAAIHVTFSPYYHSPLAALLPTKFLWGPVGAGEGIPPKFLSLFSRRQRVREALRSFVKWTSRLDPTLAFCCFRATTIIAATRDTQQFLPRIWRSRTVVEGQLGGIEAPEFGSCQKSDDFVVITSGRHEYWKGHILVLRAFHQFVRRYGVSQAKLVVLSDGPERPGLERFVRDNDLHDQVMFTGWISDRNETFLHYSRGHVYAYASLFECGGYVVVEAMSCGLPVVCVDLGGPGEAVDDNCGIKVPAKSPEDVIEGMAAAMYQLFKDKDLQRRLSEGALARVATWFDWTQKQIRIRRIVEEALNIRPPQDVTVRELGKRAAKAKELQ